MSFRRATTIFSADASLVARAGADLLRVPVPAIPASVSANVSHWATSRRLAAMNRSTAGSFANIVGVGDVDLDGRLGLHWKSQG